MIATESEIVERIRRAVRPINRAPRDETELQQWLAECFAHDRLGARREFFTAAGRVDFKIGAVAVEVKIKGSSLDVSRQIIRYLQLPDFDEGVVICTKPLLLPITHASTDVGMKPVTVLPLWRQFL